jgi:peptide/nickel transport system substrate-binding protein
VNSVARQQGAWRLSRRAALRLIGAGTVLGLAAACAPASQAPPPTTAPAAKPPAPAAGATVAAPAPAAGQPKSGGTLRVAMIDPTPLDGHVISPNVFDSVWMVYDTLTAYDDKLQPQPMLAESWDVSADFKRIQLTLRKGVQFHNGRELTSEDVVWNLQRVKDPKTGVAQLANQSNWFSSVEATDKYTVLLTSDQPRPAVFDFFEYFNVISKDAIDATDPKARLVGTGPFALTDYQQGDHLTFSKNKSYWHSGKPYLDEVRIQVIPDAQTSMVSLEAGAIDLVGSPAPRDAVRLGQDTRFKVMRSQISGQYHLLAANCVLAPTDNKLVRQALNYAADRGRFVDNVLLNTTGEPRDLPWPPHAPAYEAEKNNRYTFDLDRAKALLTEAGAPNIDIEFLYVSTDPIVAAFAQIYQADLAKIGGTVTLRPVESPVWMDTVNNHRYRGLTQSSSAYANLESSSLFTLSRHWNYSGANTTGFTSERYTQLVTAANVEPDAAKRRQLYSQINDLVLDESFVMVLAPGAPSVATRANVNGVRWSMHESRVYADMWLA